MSKPFSGEDGLTATSAAATPYISLRLTISSSGFTVQQPQRDSPTCSPSALGSSLFRATDALGPFNPTAPPTNATTRDYRLLPSCTATIASRGWLSLQRAPDCWIGNRSGCLYAIYASAVSAGSTPSLTDVLCGLNTQLPQTQDENFRLTLRGWILPFLKGVGAPT